MFLGRQAVAKAHSIVDGNGENPHIVPGPVTDYLRRFLPLGLVSPGRLLGVPPGGPSPGGVVLLD